jgi:hypothetical protein
MSRQTRRFRTYACLLGCCLALAGLSGACGKARPRSAELYPGLVVRAVGAVETPSGERRSEVHTDRGTLTTAPIGGSHYDDAALRHAEGALRDELSGRVLPDGRTVRSALKADKKLLKDFLAYCRQYRIVRRGFSGQRSYRVEIELTLTENFFRIFGIEDTGAYLPTAPPQPQQ